MSNKHLKERVIRLTMDHENENVAVGVSLYIFLTIYIDLTHR